MGYIILILFGIMVCILITNMMRSWFTKGEFFGKPSINAFLFFLGKACNIGMWIAFALHVTILDLSLFPVPIACQYIGFVTFIAGSLFVISSFLSHGVNIRFGLSDSIELLKNGIYRVSRNPMYLGFFLLDVAAIVYTANPLLIIPFVVVIYSHHKIVLSEERFIEVRCGDEWDAYASRVRRYL